MRVIDLETIRRVVGAREAIEVMREALIAHSRGECDTPMPMHLDIAPEGEAHVKSSYRRGGRHFVVKIATGFPGNAALGLSAGNGAMILFSALTGAPSALLADAGYLTDLRTAAVSALVARELRREDAALGILGTGIQARLQARMHAEVLPLETIRIWGRTPDRLARCVEDLRNALPRIDVAASASPADVAKRARLIVTVTAARAPLLRSGDLLSGTHVSAVGSDAPGKQEVDPEILRRADLLLVDSRSQCERLGEMQHAIDQKARAIELGAFLVSPVPFDRSGVSVCDFTGLGVEDLFIAEHVFHRSQP